MPYNPYSQGNLERLHQTLQNDLFAEYNEDLSNKNNKEEFDNKNTTLNICKNYNLNIYNTDEKVLFDPKNKIWQK